MGSIVARPLQDLGKAREHICNHVGLAPAAATWLGASGKRDLLALTQNISSKQDQKPTTALTWQVLTFSTYLKFAIFLLSRGNKRRIYGEVIILPETQLTFLWLDGEGLTWKSKIRQGSQPSTKSDTNSSNYGNREEDVHPFSVWDPAASSTCKECRYLGSFSQISFVSMGEGKERHLLSLRRLPFPDQNHRSWV